MTKVFWCEPTGEEITEPTEHGTRTIRVYRRTDTGEEFRDGCHALPVGAMYDATWLNQYARFTGADGIALTVITPGGAWMVDQRCSNCTLPNDDVHKCWIRHGDPRTGDIHVDKDGVTCSAGAGSIQCGSYHGFLHHGQLIP